ncbi:MAG: GtrA family protein [Gammaproteobacteria bacterium]|nr:GtrA family protein [Gammaproteobacteria bacterium]
MPDAELQRLGRFFNAGLIATAAHYLVLIILVQWLLLNAPTASSIGALLGAVTNYLLNYHYTFQSNKTHRQTLPRFSGIVLLGMALNYGILLLTVELWQWHYLLAQLLATGLVFINNYWLNRIWTFA